MKRLYETRIGDSDMRIGLTVVFGRNEEVWKGRIVDMGTLRNGKTFYYIKDAVSENGKVQSFDIEHRDIVKTISDWEIEHGCGFYYDDKSF